MTRSTKKREKQRTFESQKGEHGVKKKQKETKGAREKVTQTARRGMEKTSEANAG